ncbi:hypothetical protein GQ53DRAFT_820626 [Thozetella sp. PMI_491]|nr:hypothetical protein GQ53DRAFT_820626 [Thozetella sp. PMI_491]
MEGPELIKYAKDKASEGVDLFALLGIDATASPDDIHKAWRRTALKHHPDKAGANYDAELYESFGRARDVLIDQEAREAYSKVVSAALQKKAQHEQMSSRRRQLVEDLERREAEARGAKKPRTEQQNLHDPERAAMAARGRAKMEERKRLIREAEERERLRELERQKQDGAEKPRVTSAPEAASAQKHPSPAPATEHATPTPQAGGEAHDDEYDERIAELEQRIRERKEEKLRRKEEKKARKAGAASQPPPAAVAKEPPQKPPAPSDDGPKADAHSSRPASDKPPKPSGASSNGNPFASTMARLRAAQAQKDEEKRKAAAA